MRLSVLWCEEADVRIPPRLRDRPVVSERDESAQQEELEAAAPVSDVRHGQEQDASGLQHPSELWPCAPRLEEMLEELDCGTPANVLSGNGKSATSGTTCAARPSERAWAIAGVEMSAPTYWHPRSVSHNPDVLPSPQPSVEPWVPGLGMALEDHLQLGEWSVARRIETRGRPIVVVVRIYRHPPRFTSGAARCHWPSGSSWGNAREIAETHRSPSRRLGSSL